MTPTSKLRVLIVANACPWASWNDKISAIKAFWAPLLELDIDLHQTNFTGIPTKTYPGSMTTFGPAGATDVPGNELEIDRDWLLANVVSLAQGYDIVVFQVANAPQGLPLGLAIGKLGDVWFSCSFIQDENANYYLAGDGVTMGPELGNSAEVMIEHEISHTLYFMSGQTDNTHRYFYTNNFARVLTDIKLPNQNLINTLYQQVIVLLEEELGLLKKQKAQSDMNTSTTVSEVSKSAGAPVVIGESKTFPAKIVAWASAIKPEEGANPALNNPGNLKYSTLTASWGASKGPAASDGGFLCQFKTPAAGMFALCSFLQLGCEDELVAFHSPEARTLGGFTRIYAGNPPQGYIDAIATAIGEPETVQISTFLS